MPHLKRTLLVAARRLSVFAALLCIGCSPDSGEIVVILQAPHSPGAEILASPFPTAAAPASRDTSSDADASAPVPPDTAARYAVLADSTALLDSSFQRERASLNGEATALRTVDRTSAEYHSRYQAFEQRAARAIHFREARDRLRTLVSALRARHPALASTPSSAAHSTGPASTPGRTVIRVPADRDTVRLSLDPGDWWLSLSARGRPPRGSSPERVHLTVRGGASDTVRLH